jgi:G3E family GTPase
LTTVPPPPSHFQPPPPVVIESSGISEPLQVAETFTFADEEGSNLAVRRSEAKRSVTPQDFATLDTLVTVVDAANFDAQVGCVERLRDVRLGADEEDERSIAALLVEQVGGG